MNFTFIYLSIKTVLPLPVMYFGHSWFLKPYNPTKPPSEINARTVYIVHVLDIHRRNINVPHCLYQRPLPGSSRKSPWPC